jgi:hypothetical protein
MIFRSNGKVLDHDEASRLLPWLGTDRLAGGELERLLDHLKVCRLCRSELRDLSDLGRAADLAERGEAPDAAAIEERLGRLAGRLDQAAAGRRFAPRSPFTARQGGFGWRQTLPLAALVVLTVGLLLFTTTERAGKADRPRPAGVGGYATLSSPEEALPAGPALRVAVADSCTQGELRRLLGDAGAEIAAGPSKLGVYTIALPEGVAPERQIAAWRPLSCFTFVDKAAGAPARAES